MALTPWPSSPVALATAIAALRPAIVGEGDMLSDERLDSIGQAASALVEGYAPLAPQALRDEALIRFAGYLAGSDYGGIASENIGPRTVTYTVNHADAFRRSGAAMLLTRWRVRRAGAIG